MSERDRYRVTECRTCGAAFIWTKTQNGKRMPVDAEPSSAGNYILQDDGDTPLAVRLANDTAATYTGEKHQSHFETCPDAKRWSKKGKP
jgi:hypothetical protein